MAESELDCELCVIGAGAGGLNALHSATRHLKPSDRVVLVDARTAPGGMWQDTYDFVRLHQPHPMFTVGDIPWKKKMAPDYLADKSEVNEQFAHCLKVLGQRVQLRTLFGHHYVAHRETANVAGGSVEVEIQQTSAGGVRKIRASRLIKAIGNDVHPAPALSLASSQVRSVSPNDAVYFGNDLQASKTPIFIVGGGKTAMDTALNLIQRFPGREIRMLVGRGVMFGDRSKMFPQGWRRWLGGTVVFEFFLDVALRFSGNNVAETNRYRLDRYGLSLSKNPAEFQVGLISPEEFEATRSGLSEVIEDYLEDIIDMPSGPQMRLRSGKTLDIPFGSWIVNCTGYLGRKRIPHEPYVSESGKVLSINVSSLPFFLTSFTGYFLTHLMYRNQLLSVPLYVGDAAEISEKNKSGLGAVAESMTILNVMQLMKALPVSIFNECRLDFNLWYPLPRRLPILTRLMLKNESYSAHCRTALDRFARENGVRLGVLPHVSAHQKTAGAA